MKKKNPELTEAKARSSVEAVVIKKIMDIVNEDIGNSKEREEEYKAFGKDNYVTYYTGIRGKMEWLKSEILKLLKENNFSL